MDTYGLYVLQVLQAHMGLIISSQLSEELGKLTFMNSNSRMKSSGATDSSPSDGYTDDIEAEANSYFHQMFSGQLTIDTMIQMLARFKESSENRCRVYFSLGPSLSPYFREHEHEFHWPMVF